MSYDGDSWKPKEEFSKKERQEYRAWQLKETTEEILIALLEGRPELSADVGLKIAKRLCVDLLNWSEEQAKKDIQR